METAIKERPILFSGSMVRAILDGRKTQTRRVVKQEIPIHVDQCSHGKVPGTFDFWSIENPAASLRNYPLTCPYGKPGDRLWVRETFSEIPEMKPSGYFTDPKWVNRKYWYAADNDKPMWGGRWKPSIHMSRIASRILLEITYIRVERVQEITEPDADSEGFEDHSKCLPPCFDVESPDPYPTHVCDPVGKFRELWDKLNKSRGYGWDANPFVWVITFRRV